MPGLPFLAHAQTSNAVSEQNTALYQSGLDAYHNKQYDLARDKWRAASKLGNPQAMFNLGTLYASGEGVAKDAEQAVNYYRRAADAGLAAAQHNLALAYYQGNGVEINPKRAKVWWERAAMQDHTQAQFNLAVLIWKGEGVKRNDDEALKWFRKASSAGHEKAQQFLDDLFEQASISIPAQTPPKKVVTPGSSEPSPAEQNQTDNSSTALFEKGKQAFDTKNYKSALQNWQQAARQNNRGAQYYIGYLHENGLGVNKSLQKAFRWYEKAAQNGQAQAQHQLAQLYLNGGGGLNKNPTLGLFWMQSAADNNDLRARDYMQRSR